MAKSEGVAGDMSALLRKAVKSYGGKGGGTKEFAQGSVPEGSVLNSKPSETRRGTPAYQADPIAPRGHEASR